MIHFLDMKPREPIYTFIHDDGRNINLASGRMRSWLLASGLPTAFAPVDPEFAKTFMRDNTISIPRLETLTLEYSRLKDPFLEIEPIIICHRGTIGANGHPDVYLVDGHHRYFLFSILGLGRIRTWFLQVEQWKPYEIEGLPAMSQAELRAYPTDLITHRRQSLRAQQ